MNILQNANFIIIFTTTCHWSLSWTSLKPLKSYFPKAHFNIMPHLCLCLLSGLFPSDFPTKILDTFLIIPMQATSPAHSHPPHYAIFSSLFSLLHSWVKISPWPQTSSIWVLLLIWRQVFTSTQNNSYKYSSVHFNFYILWQQTKREK